MSEEQLHKTIIDYLSSYKPERIGLFGSFARGEHNDGSDIDILVRFHETCSLLQLVRIENELSELIGKKVDLAYIEHILDAISRILKYTKKGGFSGV